MPLQQDGYIALQEGRLHYLRIGNGTKLLLAFHGYGNNATMFSGFESHLPEYTIINIDLPYHGKSEWGGEQLQKSDLITIVEYARKETGIDKCSLLGYSMGARACLCIAELVPQFVDTIILVAPDGLVANPLYHFVTKNGFGKWLFKDFLVQPKRYDFLVNTMRKLRIVSEARYKFAMQNVNSEEKRSRLLQIWPNMALIIPDKDKLRKSIADYIIPVHVFIGAFDKVILVKYGKEFVKNINTAKLHVVDKGHWLFDSNTISQITEYLK